MTDDKAARPLPAEENAGDARTYPRLDEVKAWQHKSEGETINQSPWAEFVTELRYAAHIARQNVAPWGHLPEGMPGILRSMQAVLRLLEKQPGIMARQDLKPLLRLNAALVDLQEGRVSRLFKPVDPPHSS